MIFFITVLRTLSACLITNAHYVGVYPIEIIANGGLIGDILFFAISGYCLYDIKLSFLKWYGKRLYRIYPPVMIITAIYMLANIYSLTNHSIGWWFLYPTYYHFVASIIILYIPYYFIIKNNILKNHLIKIMLGILIIEIIVYIFIYDKTYYHIDNVREPMIRFLFMESMLLGAWFRENISKIINQFKWWQPIITFFVFLLYFASKLFFIQGFFLFFQIFNQVIIFILLFFIFFTFAALNSKLEKFPKKIKSLNNFISKITLEIYVVQYVIIKYLGSKGYFPLNWIVLTLTIVMMAFVLHKICEIFYRICDKFLKFDCNRGKKDENNYDETIL